MSASLAPKISFVSQRFTDDRLDYTDLSGLLSPFQIEKFSYFYKFFDSNGDGHVDVSFFYLIRLLLINSAFRWMTWRESTRDFAM